MNEMKTKLDASEEHNISLISDKKKLERDLSREKVKLTQAEEKIGNLERELADKKRRWKAEEKQLHDTITKLRAAIKPKSDTSCESTAVSSFANVVSSEGDYLINLFILLIGFYTVKYANKGAGAPEAQGHLPFPHSCYSSIYLTNLSLCRHTS